MEVQILVMLFLASGPLTIGQLRDLWTAHHIEWPVGSFEAFVTCPDKFSGRYVARNGKGEVELTAEGAAHLRSTGLVLFLYHAALHLNSSGAVYRSFDSIRNEHIVTGALSTLVDKGILVPDDGRPPDVSDDLCESHRLGTGHA